MFAVVSISAQNKPQALKFDEFDDVVQNDFYSDQYFDLKELTFSQHVKRFSKQLEKERGVTAYIIYYQSRITYKNARWNFIHQVNGISNQIEFNDRIKIENVLIVNGGYRENNTVEFWIVPKNAELPAPTPTFTKSETFQCANISVFGRALLNKTDEIIFSVSSYYLKEIENPTLTWKVSAGEIVEGQNKDSIKVKLNDSDPKRITAFLEVGGLPYPCPKVFTATAEIGNVKLFLTDVFGQIANGETRARLDAFLTQLHNNPAAKGYIIIYGNRTFGASSLESRNRLYRNHFAFRNVDLSRITIMEGGYREETSSELWLSFDDEKPVTTPTVDKKFVEVPKPARKPRPRRK
ncbi:MAG TPA: hypothetical protein VF692_06090 [Pyrinomonadaceae bacterium]